MMLHTLKEKKKPETMTVNRSEYQNNSLHLKVQVVEITQGLFLEVIPL